MRGWRGGRRLRQGKAATIRNSRNLNDQKLLLARWLDIAGDDQEGAKSFREGAVDDLTPLALANAIKLSLALCQAPIRRCLITLVHPVPAVTQLTYKGFVGHAPGQKPIG